VAEEQCRKELEDEKQRIVDTLNSIRAEGEAAYVTCARRFVCSLSVAM
jgi:hypothetical protein